MPRLPRPFARSLPLASCALFLALGCDDRQRQSPAQLAHAPAPASRPRPADAPGEVARAFLDAAARAQRARHDGLFSRERVTEWQAAMDDLDGLVDRAEVRQAARSAQSSTIPRDIDERAAVRFVAESWVSMLAHYADGLITDSIQTDERPGSSSITVYVEAESPADRRARDGALARSDPAGSPGQNADADQAAVFGLGPSLRVGINLTLARPNGVWLVRSLRIGPPRPPRVLPTSSPAPGPRS